VRVVVFVVIRFEIQR